MTNVTPTMVRIAEMMVENTGAALLDSGGAYGRAWQRTRAKYGLDSPPNSSYSGFPVRSPEEPTESEMERVARQMYEGPTGWIDSYGCAYVSAFHWLENRLDYDPEADAKYQRFTSMVNLGKGRYDAKWGLEVMYRFAELIEEHGGSGGPYGGGPIDVVNTYNSENALDRTLQFMPLFGDGKFLDDDCWVLLQVHGGADVRGGYTDPVLFRVMESDSLYDYDRITFWTQEGALIVPQNPDQPVEGQLDIDGGEYHEPEPTMVSRWWDTSYGNGKARHESNEPPYETSVLVFPYETSDETVEDQLEELRTLGVREYPYGNDTRRLKADVALWDEDDEVWRWEGNNMPILCGPSLV